MGNVKQKGFTIIELILFLAITGALFAALMIGVNSSIYQQRYKDSVVAYKTLIERQYDEVAYPRNERNDKWVCGHETGVREEPNGGEARGTSPCVLLGRYIQIKASGKTVETGNVVGSYEGSDDMSAASDILAIKAYAPAISPIGKQDYEVEWNATLQTPDKHASTASFLILRSPLSGLVRMFALSEPLPTDLSAVLTQESAHRKIKNCIVSSGSIGIPTQSVTVNASVASANGVVLRGSDGEC